MKRESITRWQAAVALVLYMVTAGWAGEPMAPTLLLEGTMLKSVDGVVVPADGNDLWRFEVGPDANETSPLTPAGTRLALLPSATLERLVTDANDRQSPRYRLTGQVTQYREANFLWVIYYVPLSKWKDANEPAPTPAPIEPVVEPNAVTTDRADGEELAIPEVIAERLRTRRAARGPQRATPPAAATPAPVARKPATRVLVDVVGFIESRNGASVFVPDALGWNVSEVCYGLLPCRVLEQTERQVAAWPEPVRLRVAGLMTEYRGRQYLLLQRAIRVYNYGNFGQ